VPPFHLPPQLCTHIRQNYKVYCTLHNIPIDESIADAAAADDMDVDMDVDDDDNEAQGDDDGAAMDQDEDDEEDMPTFFKELKDADAAKEAAKTPSRNPKSKVALVVKAKVNKVLTGTALADKRARQCDQNDFLKLLLGRWLPGHAESVYVVNKCGSVP
jgi:18S rRNA (adenine1779-N6/adenine1780-N6)-dimethyltransferase